MTEILFSVVEATEGGLTACAVGHSIFTEADSLEELRQNVREAVECHFEAGLVVAQNTLTLWLLENRRKNVVT